MKRTTFLTIAVVLLIATNISLIIFMFSHKRHHPPEPKMLITEKLQLDEKQQKEYQLLINEHQASLNVLDKNLFEQKALLYASLKAENQTTLQDSLLTEMSLTQKEIEHTHLNHFKALKALCNQNQMGNFDRLTDELTKLFNRKEKHP